MATNEISKIKHRSFASRLHTMLSVDFRRMFTMPLFYILLGTAFAIPVLILVMTTSVSGGGQDASMSFQSAWQILGTLSTAGGAGMDMTAMCNINLLYFMAAALVCCFVAEDFRSGYAKNLFTVRAKRTEYTISKTLVCFLSAALLLLAFFVGSVLGAAIAGLSFDMVGFTLSNLVMCLLAKILLMGVFVAIFLVASVAAKQKLWLSIVISLMVGMLLFMMIPMLTPLDATILHAGLCLIGSLIFSIVLGTVSTMILKKTSVV